jgi:glutathione S-transferase
MHIGTAEVTPLAVLYAFRRCPYAMRARLALLSSAHAYELREVLLRDKPVQMLEISPKGTVPVLQLPNGQILEQSLDIMLWALEQYDPQAWLSADASIRKAHMALIRACDGDFKSQLDRYKYPNRFGVSDSENARVQGAQYLADLDRRLAGGQYLSGDHWGLPDAAIAPFVRQWAHTDPVWFANQPWANLQSWLYAFEQSPALATIMVKVPVWRATRPAACPASPLP